MPEARLDVVVPMRNKVGLLPVAIRSIVDAARFHGAASLVVADHQSTDGSLEFVRDAFGPEVRLITCPAEATIGAVRNIGASAGSAPIIVFLDCDCQIAPEHLVRVEEVLAQRPEAAAVGCKIALPPEPTWVEKTWNNLHDDGNDGPRAYINSANLSVRRAAYSAIGGFSESLETGEDSELCQRLRHAGGVVYQDQRLSVMHLDNAKTLWQFYRKERWRALGMFGTVSLASVDKPTAMMMIHLLLLVTSAWLVRSRLSPPLLLGPLVAACLFLVPATSVAYRRRHAKSPPNWLPSLVLYQVYFLARISALFTILWRYILRQISVR